MGIRQLGSAPGEAVTTRLRLDRLIATEHQQLDNTPGGTLASATRNLTYLGNHGYVYVDCSPSGMPRAQYSPRDTDHVTSKLIEYGNIKEVTVPIPVFFTQR